MAKRFAPIQRSIPGWWIGAALGVTGDPKGSALVYAAPQQICKPAMPRQGRRRARDPAAPHGCPAALGVVAVSARP
jgi:hypothetical protein